MAAKLNLHSCQTAIRRNRIACRRGEYAQKTRSHELSAVSSAMVGACLWLGISTAAVAQSTVELAPAPANVTEHSIKLGVPALSASITLRNSGNELRYYREAKFLTRLSDGATRPAIWSRTGATTIPPGAQIALELSAELPVAGSYETFIDTYGKDNKGVEVPDRRIRVLVIREVDALPAEFMVEPKPAAETWPWNRETRHYFLTLRNTTLKRLSFTPAQIVGFTNKSGDDLTATGSAQIPSADSAACASSLDPNNSCAIDLNLDDVLGPGEYQVNVGVAGEGGGWSQRTQTIRVRATAWLAFIVIIVGAYAGSYVQAWRSKGRQAVAALIEIKLLQDAAARLDAAADDRVKPLIQLVRADIDNVESQARKDIDVTAEIERLKLWIRLLTPASELYRRFDKLSEDGHNALRAQFTAVMRGTEKSRPTQIERDALETLIQAFAENLDNWPSLERSIAKAASLLAAMDALLGAAAHSAADLTALKTPHDELNIAVNAAKAPLPVPPAGDSVSDRQTAIDRAIDKAEKQALAAAQQIADQLSASKQEEFGKLPDADPKKAALQVAISALAAWKADASGEPTAVRLRDLTDLLLRPGRKLVRAAAPTPPAAVPPIEIPTGMLIPPRGASLKELQASLWKNELLTNAIILIATGLAGVLALWVPNATWGSVGDLIGAALAGLAARVVLGEAGSATK